MYTLDSSLKYQNTPKKLICSWSGNLRNQDIISLVVLFSSFLVSGLAEIQCYAGSQSLSLKNVHKTSLAFSAP